MPDFTEVAPRVWVAHYDWMHVNITLIGGSDGLLMVDTHGSAAQARIVADDVRRLGAGPLTGLVNTHEHWDHHFGNATMVEQFGEMPIHATEWAAEHMEVSAGHTFEMYEAGDHPRRDEILATTLRPARPHLLLRRCRSTSATAPWSSSTPDAGTPRATSSSASRTPT